MDWFIKTAGTSVGKKLMMAATGLAFCGFLAAHLAGPYYSRMLALLGKYGVTDAVVSKFKVALEEPVYDPEGRPRADFFTE